MHIFIINKKDTYNLSLVGLDKLEFLQSHEMKDIYEKAFYILEKYFNTEVEDVRVTPSVDNGQYKFNPDEMTDYQF